MQNNTKKLPILEETDFQDKKIRSLSVAEKYQFFNKKKANNILDCGVRLQFGLYENIQTFEQRKKLEEMYTCKDRFCPFCSWRRARKLAIQSYTLLKAIETDLNVRYIFASFTVLNPLLNDLSSTINHMNSSFDRMFKKKRVKASILGFMRALEIPPQKDNSDYFHPHFHCLFVVPTNYFNSSLDLYIKQEEWQTLWADALRVDYLPQVDVRIIKSKNGSDPIAKAVAETIKYPLKDIDLQKLSINQFESLTLQMKNKRALSFSGLLKEYRNKLQLDDIETGDLIYDSLENEEIWKRIKSLIYDFKNGDYGLNYYERI
jgi:plasmid rolling circle replication initiator protein Rep